MKSNIARDNYNSVMYNAVKDFLRTPRSVSELKDAKKALKGNSRLYKDVQDQLIIFVDAFISIQVKKARMDFIKPFQAWRALEYDLKGEESVERKINAIKDVKLQNGFIGLFNLLTDRKNLVYNNLGTRQDVLNDLNKFKSLKFFKMSYVSPFDLKKDYGFLAVKRGAQKFHSKLYFIEHGLYVLKTLEHDGITLKAFYINNKVKNLLGGSKIKKALPKDAKFNKSSVDAWKTLEKEDNIRFYAYCNANGLDKKNRQLLKAIRQKQGGETFSCHLEQVKESLDLLEAQYDDLKEITTDNGVVLTNYEYLDKLDKIRREYWSLTEEHNSDDVPTYLEDY